MKKKQRVSATSPLWQKMALMLFGVFLSVAILEIGLQASGFFILGIQQCKNWITMKKGASYRIMCVGESTTQGQYPRFLEEILNNRQTQMRFSVIDQGLFATNTDVIFEKMEDRIKKYKPDAVVAMIGINDDGARHMPAGFTTTRRSFIQSFKTFRLMQLLYMHIQAKLWELKNKGSGVYRTEPLAMAPKDDGYFVKLGMKLHSQNQIGGAKDAFREALRLNSRNTDAYFRLMWLCDGLEQEAMVEKLVEKYQKEFVRCPQEEQYLSFAFVQLNAMHKYYEAEALLKTLRSHCRAGWIQHFSGETAAAQGQHEEAIAYYQEAIRLNRLEGQADNRPYLGLAYVYRAQGRFVLSEEALFQANVRSAKGYAAATVENYRKIQQLLKERGIRLICVQYPMRDIEPLKRIFSDRYLENVSFVDNEKLFKDVLRKYRFEEIFVDRFAGDFGHCTDMGNKLLAGNIAKVILRDVLGISTTEEALNR